jgi:beta-lactamase class D
MEEEASGVKLHLGVSAFASLSIENLHHRNRDMRDRDEIWTVGSLEISTVDQT